MTNDSVVGMTVTGEKPKYSGETPLQCHILHHKHNVI
jgi:hypothetical protein